MIKIIRIPILRPPPLKFHSSDEKMFPCKNPFCNNLAFESEEYCYEHLCKISYIEKEVKE
jgi:hypothetical protein